MVNWNNEGKYGLFLFTIDEFNQLPDGIALEGCINGAIKVKGEHYINTDWTIGGLVGFGVRNPWDHPEKDLFLTFVLKDVKW